MPSNRIAPRKPMALTAAAVFVSVWTPCRQTFNSQFIGRRLHALATAASPTSKPCTVRTRTRRYIATMIGSGNGDGRDIGAETGIIPADLKQEMTNSYMEYAMSVILGRAMPDVRDGLKPVHRRILFAMHELGLAPTSSFRKSARVVGEVLGKYHPHGDTAVYDALVRMAQGFSMSVPLVNGHGNFGSTDGDPAAAMRYTECKLSPMAKDAFLSDMDRDTVSYVANFDGSEREPLVLPVKVPNLLVNGSSGIAVGMATNIPPHNLGELVSALTALIEEPDISDEQLFELVPGPDFPTGGQILGVEGARDMYKTGKGRIVVRACAHSEVLDGEKRRQTRDAIVVTELPYQVNKAVLVSKIADLVNEKKLEGVSDLRDESDRNGTRIVIELKRDAKVPVVLNNLYKKTQLQSSFSANVMALDNGRFPVRLTLRDCLEKFLTFRKETVRRRVKFDLDRAEKRLHLVDGLLIVQSNIDAVVATIKASSDSVSARKKLMGVFELSIEQAGSVLDMQLRRLTSLEYKRLQDEWNGLQKKTSELRDTLATGSKVDSIILKELEESAEKFAAKRRSVILEGNNLEAADINELSLMSNERSVITVTEQGYIKRMATSSFESQNRGTRGKRGVGRLRAGDKIAHLFSCMTHDSLIAVSTSGTAYQLPAHKVPLGSLSSRGVPLFQLLPGVPAGETMAAVMAVTEEEEYLVLLTQCGFVKKTAVKELRSISARGKRVIALDAGDVLKWVKSCCGKDSLVIGSQNGVFIRFRTDERNLRASGRSSRGVRSIRLDEDDEIADMDVVSEREIEEERGADGDGKFLLAVTKDGTGKRIRAEGFRCQGRGGRGVKGITLGNGRRKDRVVALQTCAGNDSVMLVTSDGTIVRTRVGKIPVQGRYSRGVRIQRLGQRDRVAAVTVLRGLLADDEEEDGEEEEGEEEEGEEEDGEAADGEQHEDEGDQEGGGV